MFEVIAKDDFGRIIEKMMAISSEEAEATANLFRATYGTKRVSVIGQ